MTVGTSVGRAALRIQVRGVVQGVGFRPHVFRLAHAHRLSGWVRNDGDGVSIHVEGASDALDAFVSALTTHAPPAATVAAVDVRPAEASDQSGFTIRESDDRTHPTTRVSPDLALCDECRREMREPSNARYRYPYINCTNCGPRFSIVRSLPYDRANTTMAGWALCEMCAAEYHDPFDRRFHAQPVACPSCGPRFHLVSAAGDLLPGDAVDESATRLRRGEILAVKGIGGYHLVCDADNEAAVATLRDRKYRKEKAFAVMVRDVGVAHATVELSAHALALLESAARPIVLAPARVWLAGVAPENGDLGVMLPYAPLHDLLFDAGAPPRLVMTSGNRSSEPIAYEDEDARQRLCGLADAFLIGQRPIARRMDDSVMRADATGPVVLRRSRGLAPGAVATLPSRMPILALGGDLKNAITLVVDGQAYVSQYIGDLSDAGSLRAFDETVHDLLAMYELEPKDVLVVHDRHPQYASTTYAAALDGAETIAVQHHRAHVASVLAERGAIDRRVLGVAFDGTGWGDDESVWGGEVFAGSVRDGFERVGHLRPAWLAGGDGAARHPVQAAAGFLFGVADGVDVMAPPFCFPPRYAHAIAVIRSGVRTFPTTSAGRLFDAVAALAGFTRPITFEGQAAIWLEHLARKAMDDASCFSCDADIAGREIDWRGLLRHVIDARQRAVPPAIVARAFHRGLAQLLAASVCALARTEDVDTVVLSGGVMQNQVLLADLRSAISSASPSMDVWINHVVPANDGGLSLGQAALALQANPEP